MRGDSSPNVHAHFGELRAGVEKVRRDPEYGPLLAITAGQPEYVLRVAALRLVGVVRLLALTALRVDNLPATAEHHDAHALEIFAV